MKRILLLMLLAGSCIISSAQSDTTVLLDSSGRSHANFSIDGDTRNNYQKISSLPYVATMHHDDWFLQDGYKRYDDPSGTGTGLGNSIFDTIGLATYKAQLLAGQNVSFVKRMKAAAFDVLPLWKSPNPANGYDLSFWVDGVYYRDYAGSGGDITSFSGGKNGDNPNVWAVGNSVSTKSDLLDVYTHVRTTGINPQTDSVWFFAGVSTVGTNGNRFFDIEVYRENFSYDASSKKFSSAGSLAGHSAWTFNSNGTVSRSGDIIISVAYAAGRSPEIDFRIFIAKSTYDSVTSGKLTPATFKLATNQWNINTAGNGGYVQILAKDGNTNWGSGTANYVATNTDAQDVVQGPPWGTLNSSGLYSENYDRLQFIEIALNFSRFGMNPFNYVTSYCSSPYSSIIVKSRASTSFSANLEDFVVPQAFTVKNLAAFTVKEDTVTCAKPTGQFQITANARNYYRWYDANGQLLQADTDVKTFSPTKSGTYYIEATNFQGCPTLLPRQAVKISVDSTAPIAKALLGWATPYYSLNGVGEGTSSTTLASAPSKGLTYSWIGPDGFKSDVEDPKIGDTKSDIKSGVYNLTVTETRNSCKASSSIYVDVSVLPLIGIDLKGKLINDKVQLDWSTPNVTNATVFVIERSTNGVQYENIGRVAGTDGSKHYSFIDTNPLSGNIYYRIKNNFNNGHLSYSNTVSLQKNHVENIIVSRKASTNQITIQLRKTVEKDIQVKVLSLNGSLLMQYTFQSTQVGGSVNTSKFSFNLPASVANQTVIVALYEDTHLLEARKL